MVKFNEANSRFFKNVFVCRHCKHKMRAPSLKVVQGKISCRYCGSRTLRPKRKS